MSAFHTIPCTAKLAGLFCAAALALGIGPCAYADEPAAPEAAAAQSASQAGAAAQDTKMGSVVATDKSQAAMKFIEASSAGAEAFDAENLKPNEAAPSEFDPKTNPRLYEISTQLRCLVCANESIAESNVSLAIDLRREVAKQIKAGKTDDEIIAFMTERYGDFVLFKPPFKAKTYLLWFGPILFFLAALLAMLQVVKSRRAAKTARTASVDDAKLQEAIDILEGRLAFQKGRFVPKQVEH